MAEPQEARAEIAKLEGEVAYPEAHIAAAELLPPLHRELTTMQGRENRLLAQQSISECAFRAFRALANRQRMCRHRAVMDNSAQALVTATWAVG